MSLALSLGLERREPQLFTNITAVICRCDMLLVLLRGYSKEVLLLPQGRGVFMKEPKLIYVYRRPVRKVSSHVI